ncbi:MAG: hypothetical protein ACOH1Y_09295 [Propionicimonas sp.]
MFELVTVAAAVVTALCGLLVTVPQLFRVLSSKHVAGVSLPGWVNWCVSYTAWTVYLGHGGQMSLFLGTLGGSVVCVTTTIVILVRASTLADRGWAVTGVWTATVIMATVVNLLGDPQFISVLLSCSPIWMYGPSAWKAWRSPDVSGIAVGTWLLSLAGALTFVVAGHVNPVTVINGSVSATLSLVIVARLWVGVRYQPRGVSVPVLLPQYSRSADALVAA